MARLVISDAENTRLNDLGEEPVRRIVSETTDQIGLGQFVPVDTNADGTPATGTDWFTAHPDLQANAANALPVLAARLRFALAPTRKTKMRKLVKDTEGVKDKDGEYTTQPISAKERKRRWRSDGGDDKEIRRR